MFCNYQKQVWKAAFKIKKDGYSYQIWEAEKQYKSVDAEINELTSFENTQRVAYLLAEMDSFSKSEESYWFEAEKYIESDELLLLERFIELEKTIECLVMLRYMK